MPDCPKCGTWNPDDKTVCWRCQTPLPKTEARRPRRGHRTLFGVPLWIWLIGLAILLINLLIPYLGVLTR